MPDVVQIPVHKPVDTAEASRKESIRFTGDFHGIIKRNIKLSTQAA